MNPLRHYVPQPVRRAIKNAVLTAGEFQVPTLRRGLSYPGVCSICGAEGLFRADKGSQFAARSFPCPNCGAVLRFRNEAAALVDELGRGQHLSLETLLKDERVRALSFYNTGINGPVRQRLVDLANYVDSHYWDDGTPGERRDGVDHQDLQRLTYGDGQFDVVTSSHVLEHVPDPGAAFAEISRVLAPGGRLVFSIPVQWPQFDRSRRRAELVDGEITHLLDPAYHESPGGAPSLVFTDFGTDVHDLIAAAGFIVRQVRPHMGLQLAFRDSVFVATKLQ